MEKYELYEVLIVSCVASIGFILNVRLLIKEWKKRNADEISFFTKALKYFSLCTLISGTLYPFSKLISFIPFTCHFSGPLRYTFLYSEAVCLGYYQLSRLYYSFSQNKSYSEKGYSDKLFIIVYILGLFILLNGISFPWLFALNDYCSYNSNHQMIYKYTNYGIFEYDKVVPRWIAISATAYLVWDFFILWLYAWKVCHIIKHQKQIQKEKAFDEIGGRISRILQRIFILTMIYEIPVVLGIISGGIVSFFDHISTRIAYQLLWIFGSIGGNYAVFLMQGHNDEEYKKFLRICHFCRVYYICCCFKALIWTELDIGNALDEMQANSPSNTASSPVSGVKHNENNAGHDEENNIKLGIIINDNRDRNGTVIDTQDASYKVDHSKIAEFSIDTTMMIDQENQHKLQLPRQSTIPKQNPQQSLYVTTEDNHLDVINVKNRT